MKQRQKSAKCSNCEHPFDVVSNFCPNCGQENHTHKLPIKHFLLEFVESFTHFDAKVFRTLKEMVIQPGIVTKNYNSNMRARYVPPARIYIFMSFIFFLLTSLLYNQEVKDKSVNMESEFRKGFKESGGSGQINFFHKTAFDSAVFLAIARMPDVTNAKIDSAFKSKGVTTDWINTRVVHTMIKVYKGEASFGDLYFKFMKYVSYSVLLLMPFFALVLKLFYRKQNLFYSEFLVFSIYFHTFIFAVLLISMLFNKFIYSNEIFIFIVVIAIFTYLGLSLRRVYQQSLGLTIVKTISLSTIYTFSLLLTALAMFIGTFL
jgi:hypothetical protein